MGDVGSPEGEKRLSLLEARLDAIAAGAAALANAGDGRFQRRLVAWDIANPAPLGLFAFALATCLYMTAQAHITEQATKFIAFTLGITFGGLTMLIVAFFELLRRNCLGATAFGSYGAFWLAVGLYGTLKTAGIFFLDAPQGERALTALYGVASLGFCFVSLAVNLMLPLLFFNLCIMFLLLSGGVTNTTCGRVAGWWGIITSSLAFYIGLSMLFEDMWGMTPLPLFYTTPYKKQVKLLFPKISFKDEEEGTRPLIGGNGAARHRGASQHEQRVAVAV